MSQQLVKKGANGKHVNVMPKSWIEAIKDKNTGQTLVEILQGFNMYFLPYNGNTTSTRCLVPTMLRKKGLWITYVKYDGNVYTEWYAADEIDDKSWGDSSNWRIGNNTLVGDITISANGNWVINGTETEFKAVGEKGNTPLLRVANNRLQVSYDLGDTYRDVTNNPVYTKFRWLATSGDTQANNVGRIQASTDEGKTWSNMSNDFTNNLHISRYIGINDSLPTSGIAEGTIYAKGPYYAEDDTSNDNPIYRLWVYAWKGNTLAWQDNGEFTSISAGVVQELGDSETEVISQKVVTERFNELNSKVTTSVLLGVEGKALMDINDRQVNFDLNVREGDVIEWSASDNVGSRMIVSLFYGEGASDYIVLDKSPYTVDNIHKYTRIRFWRNAETVSEVSYSFKVIPREDIEINDRLSLKAELNEVEKSSSIQFSFKRSVIESSTNEENNWVSTDFISLDNVLSIQYYLASMEGSVAVSFYTDKDFSSQIISANIWGTTPLGISGIIEGKIAKYNFPINAKYVVFCSVNPESEYYDGDIKAFVNFNRLDIFQTLINDELYTDVKLAFPNNTSVNVMDAVFNDSNWISTDFISLDNILGIKYYLASMINSVAVSFYTDKDFSTQIVSANIKGTTPLGTSGILQGTISKEEFPTDAKYVVFCSVNPASDYYDGEVSGILLVSHIKYNSKRIDELYNEIDKNPATNVLYSTNFRKSKNYGDWVGVSADKISNNGLQVDTNGCVLYKEYGLAQRILNLCCKFNSDSIVKITSYPTKDSTLVIDCSRKTFNLNGLHEVSMPFFNAQHDYNIEIIRDYQSMKVILTDMISGDIAEYDYINNGTGGVGSGAVGTAYLTGAFHDFYQFVTTQGTFYIKDVKIMSFTTNYHAIFYGDSITEQDSYFPTSELNKSWVFKALSNMNGVASGRGGGQIAGVLNRIKNELPFFKAKYVVITIGTNGGNTEENLSELVEYIKSQNAIPILNHIPCNESGTQVSVNSLIDIIREKYNIKGADFDLCTSLNGDGKQVNKDTMFWENYSSTNNIYHHPNEKGGATMFAKLMQDVPEIFVI